MTTRALRGGILLLAAASLILCLGTRAAQQHRVPAASTSTEAKAQTTTHTAQVSRRLGSHPAPAASKPPSGDAANAPQKPNPPARRDPFRPMLGPGHAVQAAEHLPPGKAGLIISKLRVLGVAASRHGAIAIVANDRGRVYFLHDGDRLYDGRVAAVSLNGVAFVANGKDAFGRTVEVAVTKRLGAPAGEQP